MAIKQSWIYDDSVAVFFISGKEKGREKEGKHI
jgi:hypothetical protein